MKSMNSGRCLTVELSIPYFIFRIIKISDLFFRVFIQLSLLNWRFLRYSILICFDYWTLKSEGYHIQTRRTSCETARRQMHFLLRVNWPTHVTKCHKTFIATVEMRIALLYLQIQWVLFLSSCTIMSIFTRFFRSLGDNDLVRSVSSLSECSLTFLIIVYVD